MRTLNVVCMALLPCFFLTCPALAQDSPALQADFAAARRSPDNRSGSGLLSSSFQLTADVKGEKTAQLTLAATSPLGGSFGETGFAVTLSAPIDTDSGEGSLITQRGLPSGFSAELAVNHAWGEAEAPATIDQLRAGPLTMPFYVVNATGSVGFRDFKFRDPVSFAPQEERRTSYSFAAAFGYAAGDRPLFIGGGVEYRRSWKAPDQRILCAPNQPPGPQECVQSVFAPPERNTDFNLFALMRTGNLFGLDRSDTPIAMEIRVSYDVHSDVFGVEAPIYFLRGADGGLSGGIRIGWDSEDRDVVVGFFIGATFDPMRL